MKRRLCISLLGLFTSIHLSAQTGGKNDTVQTTTGAIEKKSLLLDRNQFSVGLQSGSFNYSEPAINMKDSSQLSGLRLGVRTPGNNNNLVVSGDLEVLSGSASYDGSYQDGRKLKTTGRNSILTLRGLLGNQFELSENALLTPFVGVGLRQLANKYDGPGSYRREIGYTYLPLGTEWKMQLTSTWSVGLAAEYDLFLGGTVKTYLSDVDSRNSDIQNKQSSGSGYRVSAILEYKMDNYVIAVQPYYHSWKIDDSDKVILTDGKLRYFAYEPANETTLAGVDLSLKF